MRANSSLRAGLTTAAGQNPRKNRRGHTLERTHHWFSDTYLNSTTCQQCKQPQCPLACNQLMPQLDGRAFTHHKEEGTETCDTATQWHLRMHSMPEANTSGHTLSDCISRRSPLSGKPPGQKVAQRSTRLGARWTGPWVPFQGHTQYHKMTVVMAARPCEYSF